MDSSPEQTRNVMLNMASVKRGKPQLLEQIRNANQLLKPVSVVVPFADKLVFNSTSVLARRQFEQLIGLIKAHAALNQYNREQSGLADIITVCATEEDYRNVYSLLSSIVNHSEESLSPFAMQMLREISSEETTFLTIKNTMQKMSCSYSKAYRTLGELQKLNLVVPDKFTNGVERSYQVAPYASLSAGLTGLPEPAKLCI
jgi:hypothetical protein